MAAFSATHIDAATFSVDLQQPLHTVSPFLTGVNTGIHTDYDDLRSSFPIAEQLAGLSTRLMRFPGGNELDTYHWEQPGIEVWKDGWETNSQSSYYAGPSQTNHTEYLDVDEYLEFCEQVGSEPILGVNMESGRRYNRIQDSIDEAVRLMLHCQSNGYDVVYWYIDNEPFEISGEEYGSYVNQLVPALKNINSNICIIANPAANMAQKSWGWTNKIVPFLNAAGSNVDILDTHLYWAWSAAGSNASWSRFCSQSPLCYEHKGVVYMPYDEELNVAREWLDSNGFSHIKLAAMEWNVGKSTAADWSPYKISLVQAEMMMQFIHGGLFMANIWPKYNSPQTPNERGLFNPSDSYSPRPAFSVFKRITAALEGEVVFSSSDTAQIPVVSVLSSDRRHLLVYALNKSSYVETCSMKVNGIVSGGHADCLTTDNIDGDTSVLKSLPLEFAGNTITFDFPSYSFVNLSVRLVPYMGSPAIDLDSDGMPDLWETEYFQDGTNTSASLDADGDGFTNREEFISGSNPTSSASYFNLKNHWVSYSGGGDFILQWESIPDRVYSIYWTTNLLDGFQVFQSNLCYPCSNYTGTVSQSSRSLFYKVKAGFPE